MRGLLARKGLQEMLVPAACSAAGMGVAFAGKDVLRAAIDLQLNHTDLTGLLFLQGYRKADFVSGEAG